MTGLLDLSLNVLLSMGLNWYESTFVIDINQLPQVLLSFLLSYLVIQLFFWIFSPLKKLMMILGAPFRYMHVWLHMDAAKRIEINKYGMNTQQTKSVGFWGETKGNDMTPILHTAFSTTDALKIASAPAIGAITLFIFLIISAPIFAGLGAFGLLFHIYLLFCCFGLALPSLKDYSFLFQGNTAKAGSLHPGYFLWSYFIFAFSGYIALQRTSSAMDGFTEGIVFTIIYIVALLIVSKVVRKES